MALYEKADRRAHEPARGANGWIGSPALPSLPIIEQIPVEIDKREGRRLARLAQRLLAEEPALAVTEAFRGNVAPGLGPWPCLVIEDHSAIALSEDPGDLTYAYRALLLAGEGDQVVTGVQRSLGFENYCRDVLGLGRVEILTLQTGASAGPLAQRAANEPRLVDRAAERARASGGLNVICYMGTGNVWRLAGRIAAHSGAPVRVAAPPPRLTRRVNDKLWFAQRVTEVLGRRASPPATAAFSLAALVGQVAALARRFPSVAVKLVDSASSAGNIVIDSAEVSDVPLRALRARLGRVLRAVGWQGASRSW
jgi:hypothetical protein